MEFKASSFHFSRIQTSRFSPQAPPNFHLCNCCVSQATVVSAASSQPKVVDLSTPFPPSVPLFLVYIHTETEPEETPHRSTDQQHCPFLVLRPLPPFSVVQGGKSRLVYGTCMKRRPRSDSLLVLSTYSTLPCTSMVIPEAERRQG